MKATTTTTKIADSVSVQNKLAGTWRLKRQLAELTALLTSKNLIGILEWSRNFNDTPGIPNSNNRVVFNVYTIKRGIKVGPGKVKSLEVVQSEPGNFKDWTVKFNKARKFTHKNVFNIVIETKKSKDRSDSWKAGVVSTTTTLLRQCCNAFDTSIC